MRRKAWAEGHTIQDSAVCRHQAPGRPILGAQAHPLLGQRGREKVPASSKEVPVPDPGQN